MTCKLTTAKTVILSVLVVTSGVVACARSDQSGQMAAMQKMPEEASTSVKPSRARSSEGRQSPYLTEVRVLGEFTDEHGFRRKYVQIAPGLSDAQLIDLAKRMHAMEPETWFWMLDDGAQSRQMMESLPRTAQGDFSNYPHEWVEQHTRAHMVMELVPGEGRRWVLAKGYGADVLAVLSVAKG